MNNKGKKENKIKISPLLNVLSTVCQSGTDRKRTGADNTSELLHSSDLFLALFKSSCLKAENSFDV